MTPAVTRLFEFCPKHLYIHWPFCKNKCHYCDFVAFEKHEKYVQDYHRALCSEIASFGEQYAHYTKKPTIDTIFIGGGTPSLWPLSLIGDGFDTLSTYFDLDTLKEATIEVNPGGITDAHLVTWKKIGLNRLSIGVQVLADDILAGLNRHQKTVDVQDLLTRAPAYFDNISVDLIIGLPGVTDQIWWETLYYVTSQPITHISIYFLTIHEQTPLFFGVKKGAIALPDEDKTVDLYEQTVAYLVKVGFVHYEISNFAKPGYESVHNQAYWDRRPYKGFGIGAASFDGMHRTINVKNLLRYLGNLSYPVNVSSQENAWYHLETLSKKQEFLEVLMLGLRQKKGIGLQRMVYYLSPVEADRFYEEIAVLKERLLITEEDGHIALTERGMILENEVVAHLLS